LAALNRFQSLTYQHQQIVDGCTHGPSTSPQCYLDENKYAWPGNLATFGVGGPVFIPKVYDGRNKFFFFVAGTIDNYTDVAPTQASIPTVAGTSAIFLLRLCRPITQLSSTLHVREVRITVNTNSTTLIP
jgi:hypothetical protein